MMISNFGVNALDIVFLLLLLLFILDISDEFSTW